MTSIGLVEAQVDALHDLMRDRDIFAVDITPSEHMSLDVFAFIRAKSEDEGFTSAIFNISIAGTVREREAVA